jgi:hypothetical protein
MELRSLGSTSCLHLLPACLKTSQGTESSAHDVCPLEISFEPLGIFQQLIVDDRSIFRLVIVSKNFVRRTPLLLSSRPTSHTSFSSAPHYPQKFASVSMAEEVVTAGGQEEVTTGGVQREEWSSRWAFYFAGVGAAVGFGEFDETYDEKHQLFAYQRRH